MQFPRLPDWTIYAAVVGVLLAVSLSRRENADAPPPPAEDGEGALLGPITPFDATVTVDAPDTPFKPTAGTAFSIAGRGRWVTARHVVEGCRRPALVIGGGRAVAADVRLAPRADVALLLTDGGPVALPVAGRYACTVVRAATSCAPATHGRAIRRRAVSVGPSKRGIECPRTIRFSLWHRTVRSIKARRWCSSGVRGAARGTRHGAHAPK